MPTIWVTMMRLASVFSGTSELQVKVPEATVKRNVEYAQQQKDALWRQLMDETGAAIREDGKIAPIVAAQETLRPLPDGFLLVDEAPCANAFTQQMHRSSTAVLTKN